VDSFAHLARQTRCPYSRDVRWLELPRQGDGEDWPGYTARIAGWFTSQPLSPYSATLDMLVTVVTDPAALQDLQSFTRAVRVFVMSVCDDGPDLDRCRLLDHGWRLMAGGEAFFGMTFAPFYGRDHPRYSHGVDGYIVLQFEESFTRHGIASGKTGRRRISEAIRHRFEQHGQPYFSYLTTQAPKSLRLVKPLRPQDPPVEWWNP
jgi:hypothetical protein